MKPSTVEINRIVDRAYSALDCLNDIDITPYRNRCFAMAWGEEKRHRRGCMPASFKPSRAASMMQAAKLFTVMRIAQALTATMERKLTIKDVLHMQPSAIYAASIVANYGAQILTAWSGIAISQLADINYASWMRNGEDC